MLPIVFQALPKWDSNYNSTALTISKMLSEKRKVFYVEHPFSYLDSLKPGKKSQTRERVSGIYEYPFKGNRNFIVIHPPFTLPLNSLPDGKLYSFLKKQYIKSLWKYIDETLMSFGISEFGYVNSFDPVYFEFESKLVCRFKIYHSVDLISGEPYIAKHGVKAEFKASKQADRVITTSEPLRERLTAYNSKTKCIPNAVDFELFSNSLPKPEEYEYSTRKKMVYTGNIGLRIDYPVIERIAKEFPDLDIFMVGPKDPSYFKGQDLEKINNVHFLGSKSMNELPAYIQHADFCFIPFNCTELTRHIYPLKLNEYLSGGKPIISSNFTDFGEFDQVLNVYKSKEEAVELVRTQLKQEEDLLIDRRIELASSNTWNHRFSMWRELVEELESDVSRP